MRICILLFSILALDAIFTCMNFSENKIYVSNSVVQNFEFATDIKSSLEARNDFTIDSMWWVGRTIYGSNKLDSIMNDLERNKFTPYREKSKLKSYCLHDLYLFYDGKNGKYYVCATNKCNSLWNKFDFIVHVDNLLKSKIVADKISELYYPFPYFR